MSSDRNDINLFPDPEMIVYVSPRMLREEFNASQIPVMIQRGELTAEYVRNAHLKYPEAVGEPMCNHSQIIHYLDSQEAIPKLVI
jgi:hypothetical protein